MLFFVCFECLFLLLLLIMMMMMMIDDHVPDDRERKVLGWY